MNIRLSTPNGSMTVADYQRLRAASGCGEVRHG